MEIIEGIEKEIKNKEEKIKNILNYIDLNIKEVQFDGIKVLHEIPLGATILVMYTSKSTDWEPYFKLQYLKEILEEMFLKYKFEFVRDE